MEATAERNEKIKVIVLKLKDVYSVEFRPMTK